MASTPPENEAFLREVDDELRRDQLQGFWKRWGRWLTGGLIASLALFATYLWWDHQKTQKAGLEGETLLQVLDALGAGKSASAEAQLKTLSTSKNSGYHASARMALAALKLQNGDNKGASAEFSGVINDGSIAQPWRDLALIRQTATEFDALKPDEVISRLKMLSVAGNPWFGSAGEMVALSYAKLGKPQLAVKLFDEMAKDESVPETIRSRAVQMRSSLAVNSTQQNMVPAASKDVQK